MTLAPLRTLSGRGEKPDQFRVRITDLAVGGDDRLFAAGDREVKLFASNGDYLDQFATRDAAWSIASDEDSLWLGFQGRVEHIDDRGTLRHAITDARLGRITGVAAHEDRLLVADATHKTLHLYDKGRWVREVGADVNTRGFMIPNGVLSVAFDPRDAAFVVAHPQKHRIERYDLDGDLIDKFGRFGHDVPDAFGGCCNPTTCATIPVGLILVSEKAPPRVKVFDSTGHFVAMTTDDVFDPGAKNHALAGDRRGRVYASDNVRGVIEVFQLAESP